MRCMSVGGHKSARHSLANILAPTTVKVPHQCEGSDRKDYNDWIKWLLNGIRRECRFGKDSGLPSETSGDCKGQCRTVICLCSGNYDDQIADGVHHNKQRLFEKAGRNVQIARERTH